MSSTTAEPAPVKVCVFAGCYSTTDLTSGRPSLTLGPCLGAIKELFAKITSIDAKYGKFDFALCVGNFFGPPTHAADEPEAQKDLLDLLEGKVEGTLAAAKPAMPRFSHRCIASAPRMLPHAG